VPAGSSISIDQMCLLNNSGRLRIIDVAGVAETLCNALANSNQRRPSTLTLYGKILRILSDEKRISSTSLIYMITHFATLISDQDLFTVAMAIVVEIRSALFSIAGEAWESAQRESGAAAHKITIRFSESYERSQADILRETLAHVSGSSSNHFIMTEVRKGSTIIEMAISTGTSAVVSLGALLVAINFVLRQAEVTLRRWSKVKRATAAIRRGRHKPEKATHQRARKVPAVLRSGAVAPEFVPVREAVARYGRALVEMDERAHPSLSCGSARRMSRTSPSAKRCWRRLPKWTRWLLQRFSSPAMKQWPNRAGEPTSQRS